MFIRFASQTGIAYHLQEGVVMFQLLIDGYGTWKTAECLQLTGENVAELSFLHALATGLAAFLEHQRVMTPVSMSQQELKLRVQVFEIFLLPNVQST